MSMTVRYAKAVWVISTAGLEKNNLKCNETFRGQRGTMNAKENIKEPRLCLFEGIIPSLQHLQCYRKFNQPPCRSVCMENAGKINDKTSFSNISETIL